MKRKWDVSNGDTQKKCINEVIARVQDIEDSEVGIIAAQDIIDIVTENLGPDIYNTGVRDSKNLLQVKLHDLETELDLLEQDN